MIATLLLCYPSSRSLLCLCLCSCLSVGAYFFSCLSTLFSSRFCSLKPLLSPLLTLLRSLSLSLSLPLFSHVSSTASVSYVQNLLWEGNEITSQSSWKMQKTNLCVKRMKRALGKPTGIHSLDGRCSVCSQRYSEGRQRVCVLGGLPN